METPDRPRCPRCKTFLFYQAATATEAEAVKCLACGWFKLRPAAAPIVPSVPGVPSVPATPAKDSKTPVGPCNTCKRTMRLISSGGVCSRCYKRSRKGLAPVAPAVPATLSVPPVPSVTEVPSVPSASNALVFVFQGDNYDILKRFETVSRATGGNPEDDLCTIIDLYLDGQLQFRETR